MRSVLPLFFAVAFCIAGCSSPQAKEERATAQENSRRIESRRMSMVQRGETKRGAEILVPDETRAFNPNTNAVGGLRKYGASGSRTKEFYYDQKVRPSKYQTGEFATAGASASGKKFATSDANANGKYIVPDVRDADVKTAATREARDAGKTAATSSLSDGQRPYLGPESRRLRNARDPRDLADWRNGGEAVVHTEGSVERVSTLKPLTIEDIRDLLNTNK